MRNIIFQQQRKKQSTTTILPVINNQLEEIAYFSAYSLPISEKSSIQTALNTYGSIRLEKGDYSGVNITIGSNQKIYGHSSLTLTSPITIQAGSSNIILENLISNTITLQSGNTISNCLLKSIRYTTLQGTNVQFENNTIINCVQSQILFDCSSSGFIRNNKIIRHQIQTDQINLVMKGNTSTPSYGNVNLHTNFLTSGARTTDIDTLSDSIFVGVDAEGWNLNGTGTEEMFVAKNIGKLKISNFSGDNGYSQVKTGAYNIDSDELFILNKTISANNISKLALKTNSFLSNSNEECNRVSGTVTGYTASGHIGDYDFVRDGLATDQKLISSIIGTQYTPWTKPIWESIPNPLGITWATDRVGKPDSRAYTQNLIDTNGIAELPEGIFYISSTLNIHLNGTQGILGKGTGKTVICGLTDNFPLITLDTGTDSNFTLSYLTLQGGSVGIYAGKTNGVGIGQIAYQNLKYIVFRNQNYGIQLRQITGIDSNFFERLDFVNCNIPFFQDPYPTYTGLDTSSYIDKTVFYKCQFINSITSISMLATRASNLNLWLDCKFDGGQKAFDMNASNNLIIANCEFTNFNGEHIIKTNAVSIYSSKFINNTPSSSIISSVVTNIEGCELLDSVNVFSAVEFNPIDAFIFNSKITGNILTTRPNNNYGQTHLLLANNELLSNPTLSKVLVNVNSGVPTVLINTTPTPYPQLLVTQ